jgi:hypothetical protein
MPNYDKIGTEAARELSKHRWDKDSRGIDTLIDRLVKRAPAITQEQKDRLATLLRSA